MTDASKVRVLVVDDSAFARKVLREILNADPRISVVGTAKDGLEALEQIVELKPDVITLDLVMPNLDGVGVLRALPPSGTPRALVVSISDANSDLGIQALQAGAIDVVQKTSALATDRLFELSDELRQKVMVAAAAAPRLRATPGRVNPPAVASKVSLVVVGASTGGPQALSRLVPAFAANLPVPVAIALHIPAGYTNALAKRLHEASSVSVSEASIEATELVPGKVVVAQGGTHLAVRRRTDSSLWAELDFAPQESLYAPSVDHLFRTAARAAGSGVLGVVLTGMGDDGLSGSRAIREAGGAVLVESESSCIVHGMPRAVQAAGLAAGEAPLQDMAALISSLL